MRYLFWPLVLITVLAAGCSSPLKRCAEAFDFEKAGVYSCPRQVDGIYRICEKPRDLYHCTELP